MAGSGRDPLETATAAAQNALSDVMYISGMCTGAAAMLGYISALQKGQTPEQALSTCALEDAHLAKLATLISNHAGTIRSITGLEKVSPT